MYKGGVGVLEQPPSSLAWLESANFELFQEFQGHLAWVDACRHGKDWAKSWCFASNSAKISRLAALCNRNIAHQSIAGVKSRHRGVPLHYNSRISVFPGSGNHRLRQLQGYQKQLEPSPLAYRSITHSESALGSRCATGPAITALPTTRFPQTILCIPKSLIPGYAGLQNMASTKRSWHMLLVQRLSPLLRLMGFTKPSTSCMTLQDNISHLTLTQKPNSLIDL